MAAAAGVKGRNADQAVDAAFRFQITIGMGTVGGKGGTFDAGLITRQQVIHFGFKSPAFGKTQIHAQQYLRPILGLSAAGAGMNSDEGIFIVVFAAQHHLQLQATQILLLDLKLIGGFGQDGLIGLFLGQIQEDFQIFETLFLIFPGLQGIGQGAAFFKDFSGQGGIFPKIGFGGQEFDLGQASLFLFQIKDDLEVA